MAYRHKKNGKKRVPNAHDRNREERTNRDSRDQCDEPKGRKFTSDEHRGKGMNDLSWYTKYPELSAATASIPFPYRPGMQLPTSTLSGMAPMNIPGVCRLDWMPSFGRSIKSTDPATLAVREIYGAIRKSYSSSLEVDPPDLLTYFGGLDSIFAYIAWLKRVYRTINAYSPSNYATPETLLQAYGFTPQQSEEMRLNKMQLFEQINSLVRMSQKFVCPAVFDLFNRHYWMSDNVYTDANTMNAQFYVFNPVALFAVAPYTLSTGAQIEALYMQYCTVDYIAGASIYEGPNINTKLYNYGVQLISSLAEWDDSYTISGYLRRAYEGAPQFTVELLPYGEELTPVYNEEVLSQIENYQPVVGVDPLNYPTTFPGSSTGPTALDAEDKVTPAVWHDPVDNIVISANRFNFTADSIYATFDNATKLGSDFKFITSRSEMPTAGDVIVASRMMTVQVNPVTGSTILGGTLEVESGSEIALGIVVYDCQDGQLSVNKIRPRFNFGPTASVNFDAVAGWAMLSQFDWHPLIFISRTGNDATEPYSVCMSDIHNTTTITTETLKAIHRVCLLSELNAFRD